MQAIILAGGFGTRLQSVLGTDIPKPMAPLGDEPFLAHYIRYLRAQGVGEVMLSVGYLKEAVKEYFQQQFAGVKISYAEEEQPLGTGGAVRLALSKIHTDDPVLVVNGDCFVELSLEAMFAAHRLAGSTLSIALRRMPDCSRYGEALVDDRQRITAFQYPGRAQEGWISTGAYVVSPNIFAGFTLPEAFSFETDFQQPYVSTIRPLAWEQHGYFIDIGVPEDYARAVTELGARKAA